MKNTLKTALYCSFFCLSLTSCQIEKMHGQKLDTQTITELKSEQVLSKEQVLEMLGSPSLAPDYSKDTWYYVYIEETKRAWFKPVIRHEQVVKLTFKDTTLANVEILNDAQQANLPLLKDITPTPGTQKTALQKFVTNFGKFNVLSKRETKR